MFLCKRAWDQKLCIIFAAFLVVVVFLSLSHWPTVVASKERTFFSPGSLLHALDCMSSCSFSPRHFCAVIPVCHFLSSQLFARDGHHLISSQGKLQGEPVVFSHWYKQGSLTWQWLCEDATAVGLWPGAQPFRALCSAL